MTDRPQRPPLGANIERLIREGRWKNPRVFALEAGVNYDTLRSIMRGNSKNARSDTVEKIARGLGVAMATLRGEQNQAAGPPPCCESSRSTPAETDDAAFGEVALLVAGMLAEARLPTDHGTVAQLAMRAWREARAMPDTIPFPDRVRSAIEERRSELLRRREALLRGRH